MAGEKDYSELKNHLSVVLRACSVADEVIGLVTKEQSVVCFTMLSLYALDGFSYAEMDKMFRVKAASEAERLQKIRKERESLLLERYAEWNKYLTLITTLQEENKVLNAKKGECGQEIFEQVAKEIEEWKLQMERLERQMIASMDQKENEINERNRELARIKKELEQVKKEKREADAILKQYEKDRVDTELEIPARHELTKRMGNCFGYKKRKEDSVVFATEFLSNTEFNDAQKEFFLACYEKGYSVEELKRIAAPGLTPKMMLRLLKTCLGKEK